MVSAVYRAPVIEAQTDSLSASVRSQAAAGHFRAIALWLNEPLAPQGIYIQVQADPQPGCLRLLLEFEQPPLQERLVRFLCHRIWLLNSPLIEGIYVIARPANRRTILWQQRIRIITPALKERRRAVVAMASSPASPLPPRLKPDKASTTADPQLMHLVGHHLKTLRAFVLTGSAVAAFVFGCLMEAILSGSSPMLPTFSSGRPDARQAAVVADASDASWDADADVADTSPGEANAASRSPIVDAALEPVVVVQHDPPPPKPQPVTLLFGGDVSLGDTSYDEAGKAKSLFAGLKDYQKADLSMVNLATPLATAATSLEEELHQHTRPEAINLLKEGGVDLVNLSSESNMEFGGEGLAETLETLDREGLYRVGAGRNEQEARRPEIIDIKGQRIAYLSYAQGGDEAAHGDRPGINAQGQLQMAEDIRALRDQVDWIVVNYRWQTDIPTAPADWQKNIARVAIDQGADLVVGYHPSTLQGAEVYKGRPIIYSLGDFIFKDASTKAEDAPAKDQDTAVLKVSLRNRQMKVEFVPVRVRNAQVDMATGRDGKKILQQIEESSASLENPMKSPVILKLKGTAKAPQGQPTSPEGSFVAPAPTEAQPATPSTDKPPQDAPTDSASEPEFKPSEPESKSQDPLPNSENLQNWGPKATPSQQFSPIPDTVPQSTLEDSGALPRSNVYEPAGSGSSNESTGYGSDTESAGYGSSNESTGYGSDNGSTGYGVGNEPTGDGSGHEPAGYGSDGNFTGYGSAGTGLSSPAQVPNSSGGRINESAGYGSSANQGLSSPARPYQPYGDGPSQYAPTQGDDSSQYAPSQDETSQDESYQEGSYHYEPFQYEPPLNQGGSYAPYNTQGRLPQESAAPELGMDAAGSPSASEEPASVGGNSESETSRPSSEPSVGPLGSKDTGAGAVAVAPTLPKQPG